MKRRQLISHLKKHGCFLVREGGNHSWWSSVDKSRRSAVPRHIEIVDLLAKKICADLGIPSVK